MKRFNLNKVREFVNCKVRVASETKERLQYFFTFENNKEVDIIRDKWSYGGEQGLYEMAFWCFEELIVAGYLTERQVLNLLKSVEVNGINYTALNCESIKNDNNIIYQE